MVVYESVSRWRQGVPLCEYGELYADSINHNVVLLMALPDMVSRELSLRNTVT